MKVSICTAATALVMFENYARFTNMADPKQYAQNRLKPFTEVQIQEALNFFKVVSFEDKIIASAYFHPGGWIQEASFSDPEAFLLLIDEENKISIAENEDPYFFQLNNYPESRYEEIEKVMSKLSYIKDTDYDMKINIFGLQFNLTTGNFVSWSDEKDRKFEQVYKETTKNPYPWQIIKFQTGGGKFEPLLWKITEENHAIVGINSPVKIIYSPNVYTIVVANGNEANLEKLVQASLLELSSLSPNADVVTHCLSKKRTFYENLGFRVVESRPHFRLV